MRLKSIKPRIATLDTRAAKPPEKRADPIYHTPEYQKWRAQVIARAKGVCEWPGCKRAEPRMFADHIVELQDDPTKAYDPSNGQCLCGSHHVIKTVQERARRHAGR